MDIPCTANSVENPEETTDLADSAQKLKAHAKSIKPSPQIKILL